MTDKNKKEEIEDMFIDIERIREIAFADGAAHIEEIIKELTLPENTEIFFYKSTGAVHIVRKTGIYVGNGIGRLELLRDCNAFNRSNCFSGTVFYTDYDEDGDYGEYLYCRTVIFVFEAALPEHSIRSAIERMDNVEKLFYQTSGFVRNIDVYNNIVLDDWDLY